MKAKTPQVRIGSTVWLFDENNRVYPRDKDGKYVTGERAIYREFWVPYQITGETSRSWLLSWGRKVPKCGGPTVCFSPQEVDGRCWLNAHRYRVVQALERCKDVNKVKEIARLLGYKEVSK